MSDDHDHARARYEFKRKLEEIQSMQGRGTELISLYVPPDKQIPDVTAYLRNELSQASNIKSKSTRKNVGAAIESILNRWTYGDLCLPWKHLHHCLRHDMRCRMSDPIKLGILVFLPDFS